MAGTGYEIFALFMRYVFVILGGIILLRAFLWLRKDARNYRKEIRSLPDAGLVGEVMDMDSGKRYPLPREGVLGAARSCDIRIRSANLPSKALRFLFVEGKGVQIVPVGRQNVYLDGEKLRAQGYALHGTQLETGGAVLRIRLFAGLKVPRRVLFDEDGVPLLPEDQEVSPFEEVAGMYEPAADDNGLLTGGFEAASWTQEMPPAPYPIETYVPGEQGYAPRSGPCMQYQAPDYGQPPAEPFDAPPQYGPENGPCPVQNWQQPMPAPPQDMQPQPVVQPERHRRSERYL